MTRKIIHCDCDCFYAAVEMRDNPALRDIPIAIGGRVENRGVIATCNYPARRYGIHSAMPTAQALKRCPELTLIHGNMSQYKAVSQQIFAIYRELTPWVEPLSLDEAYLDVSDVLACQGSATRMAEWIRQRVRTEVGITVSAGVAPNKFLAKIASDWQKPDGLFVITPDQVETFVTDLPVERISGVGPQTTKRLHQWGLKTCGDIRQWPQSELLRHFGRFGQRLYAFSRGEDHRPVQVSRERKSVSTEHTYSEDLPDLAHCQARLPELITDLQQRYDRLTPAPPIRGLVVKLKFNDFTQTTVEQTCFGLDESLVAQLLRTGWERGEGKPVRLMGIGFRLRHEQGPMPTQLPLF